jgi:HAD superfamily hydrolase (TIGR01509 family)
MKFQGVLLDVDGTLVLSNDAHARAWVQAFADSGYDVQLENVKPLIGMGGDKVIPTLMPGLNDQDGDGKAISARRKELIINHYAPTLAPTRGARELVLHLQQVGLELIIASSATSEELSLLLKAADVEGLIEQATTIDDAEASKPAPDIVEAALSKLKIEPSQAVMIGDTPYDIQAANACGVEVIALRCGGFEDTQLAGAIAIYNDPADLLAHFNSALGEAA